MTADVGSALRLPGELGAISGLVMERGGHGRVVGGARRSDRGRNGGWGGVTSS